MNTSSSISPQRFAIEVISSSDSSRAKTTRLNIAGAKVGDEITFDKVLLVNNEGAITVGAPTVAGATVVCEVSQVEVRGKKIKVFHKIRRKGFDKLVGARQHFTEVLVKSINA